MKLRRNLRMNESTNERSYEGMKEGMLRSMKESTNERSYEASTNERMKDRYGLQLERYVLTLRVCCCFKQGRKKRMAQRATKE